MENGIENEYLEVMAMALLLENTPKPISEEDGEQPPMPENRIEYGAAIPEVHE